MVEKRIGVRLKELRSEDAKFLSALIKQYRSTAAIFISYFESSFQNFPPETFYSLALQLGISYSKKKKPTFLKEHYHRFATHEVHLFLNKMLNYSIIKTYLRDRFEPRLLSLIDSSAPKKKIDIKNRLDFVYNNLIDKFEFAPLFQPDLIVESCAFPKSLSSSILSFGEFLDNFDFSQLSDDNLADLYQLLIPLKDRKALGQIYTPNEIGEFMAQLAIHEPNASIFDPACGCGTLLRKAYTRLNDLNILNTEKDKQNRLPTLHKKLLNQLWGVEINEYAAHLAMMTLSFMDFGSFGNLAGILVEDFMDFNPIKEFKIQSKNIKTGKIFPRNMPRKFDVILANPPYIKQELIPHKKRMIKQLPIYASHRCDLTQKTDYYGFFLWYSTFFLKENGRLCFIIPNKWLDVKYGEKLKSFLLEHYCIRAIISFDKNVFQHAQVSTIILIADRISKAKIRNKNIVKFINLHSKIHLESLDSLVQKDLSSSANLNLNKERYQFLDVQSVLTDLELTDVQCTVIFQDKLLAEEKWSLKFLFQSKIARYLDHLHLISLQNSKLTSVIGGIKTGANAFFFPSDEMIKKLRIESQFLLAGIQSGRKIPNKYVLNSAPNLFLYVPEDVTPNNLDKWPGLSKFIKFGCEEMEYPLRPSIIWKPWYHIPPNHQDCPDILFLRHIDRNFKARWNQIKCIVADGVRGIKINNPKYILFYLGVCNSLFFYWQAHMWGRWEGQGDLQLLVYELKQFKIPDIRSLTLSQRKSVELAMKSLINWEKEERNPDSFDRLQKSLDLAVLDSINARNLYSEMKFETQQMEHLRLHKHI
ncbi:MAG: HsdM family class I SAM-dependent methyltransferase [Promethearchaeota archaeon]